MKNILWILTFFSYTSFANTLGEFPKQSCMALDVTLIQLPIQQASPAVSIPFCIHWEKTLTKTESENLHSDCEKTNNCTLVIPRDRSIQIETANGNFISTQSIQESLLGSRYGTNPLKHISYDLYLIADWQKEIKNIFDSALPLFSDVSSFKMNTLQIGSSKTDSKYFNSITISTHTKKGVGVLRINGFNAVEGFAFHKNGSRSYFQSKLRFDRDIY